MVHFSAGVSARAGAVDAVAAKPNAQSATSEPTPDFPILTLEIVYCATQDHNMEALERQLGTRRPGISGRDGCQANAPALNHSARTTLPSLAACLLYYAGRRVKMCVLALRGMGMASQISAHSSGR